MAGVVGNGARGDHLQKHVTVHEVAELAHLLHLHVGGGAASVTSELVDDLLCHGAESGAGGMRVHRGEEVTQLAAGVETSIRDALEPFVVVIEQLSQLQVDGGGIWLVNDLTVHEVGE